MKRKSFLLSILALVLIACAVIHPALAYFTDNTDADGAIPLYFERGTEIKEEVKDLTKTVTITNTGGTHPEKADPVWIRAKAAAGENYMPLDVKGDGWSLGADGYWHYVKPLLVGESAKPLYVTLTKLPADTDMEYVITNIAVAVVYESTTAFYDEDGVSFKAETWDPKVITLVDSGKSSPGGN